MSPREPRTSGASAAGGRRAWPAAIVPLVVAALTVIPFLPALSAGFSNFDDHGVLIEVDGYRGLSWANLSWMFTTTHMGHYQPLTWVSYAIDDLLFGLDPTAFHRTSLIIHGLNAALVYLLAARLLAAARPGLSASWGLRLCTAGGALLWSLHPLRVESVAWVTERRDVLSGFFLLLSALMYMRAFPVGSARPASTRWYAASVVLLLFSLLSKAWGITFFVVLLAIDWYPLARLPRRLRDWRWATVRPVLMQKVPYAALGLLFAAQAGRAQGSMAWTVKSMADWGVVQRLCQVCYGLCFYIEKSVWPTRLAALYELPETASPTEPRFLAALAIVAVAMVVVLLTARRWPALTAAAAAYAAIIAPVLGVLQSGIQLVADRYSYLATIPFWLLLAGGALVLGARGRTIGAALMAAATAACVGLSVRTWRQSELWQNTEALFAHALAVGQDGPILRENYGRQAEERGDLPLALEQFETATRLNPKYGEAWYSRGNVLKSLGRYSEALDAYRNAAETMPDAWRADVALGLLYHERMNDLGRARAAFESAVRKLDAPGANPTTGRPYLLLAAVLDEMNDPRGCREMLLRAAKFPDTRREAMEHLRDYP